MHNDHGALFVVIGLQLRCITRSGDHLIGRADTFDRLGQLVLGKRVGDELIRSLPQQ